MVYKCGLFCTKNNKDSNGVHVWIIGIFILEKDFWREKSLENDFWIREHVYKHKPNDDEQLYENTSAVKWLIAIK